MRNVGRGDKCMGLYLLGLYLECMGLYLLGRVEENEKKNRIKE